MAYRLMKYALFPFPYFSIRLSLAQDGKKVSISFIDGLLTTCHLRTRISAKTQKDGENL